MGIDDWLQLLRFQETDSRHSTRFLCRSRRANMVRLERLDEEEPQQPRLGPSV